jgi:hypothetical protein
LDQGLPRSYTPDLYKEKCSAVFEHFMRLTEIEGEHLSNGALTQTCRLYALIGGFPLLAWFLRKQSMRFREHPIFTEINGAGIVGKRGSVE